jgi:hypothetical protein
MPDGRAATLLLVPTAQLLKDHARSLTLLAEAAKRQDAVAITHWQERALEVVEELARRAEGGEA